MRKTKKILKILKYLFLVLFIAIAIFNIKLVNAGINDSTIEKNRVNSIYAQTIFKEKEHFFYLNMYTLNGIISYCVEMGIPITTDIYNSTYDFTVSNLTNEQLNYIRNIIYFGYGYPGHTDKEYYMAVQEIVWEYLNNVEIKWTDSLYMDTEINIDSYKNEILSLVDEYNKGVNLAGFTNNKEVTAGETLTLNNLNLNTKHYNILSGEHSTVTTENDQVSIKFDSDYTGYDTIIIKRKNLYETDSLLYYQGESQKLISNGNINDETKLTFYIKGHNVSFQLVDSINIKKNNQYNYKGIEFEVYNENNELITSIVSNEDGLMNANNLPKGKYYLKQIKTNEAYKLKNDYYYFETDSKNNLIEVEPIINTLEILKLYGEENTLLEEENITFNIYNNDDTIYDSITTNNKGLATINLPFGIYKIKQQNTTEGYNKVEDFTINLTKQHEEIIKHTLIDSTIKINLEIISIDEDSELIKEDKIFYKIKDKKTNEYIKYNNNIEFQSTNGTVIIPKQLIYGDYQIEVINKNKNYKEINDKIDLTINNNSNFTYNDSNIYITAYYNFQRIKTNIKIKTLKEQLYIENNNYYYKNIVDDNVELSLFANNDILLNNSVIYKKGDLIQEIITNDKGEYLIKDLYSGEYCIKDKKNQETCFEVSLQEKTITIKNLLDKGSLIIHNISSNTENIKNTVIELYDKDNNLLNTSSTNDEGIIKIDNLKVDEYCIKQKSIDNNYELIKEKTCFNINKDKTTKLELVNNKKEKNIILIPNTLNDKKSLKKLILLFFIMIGVLIYKKKISNNN